MKTTKAAQKVLGAPSAEFDRLGRFQGFSSDLDHYLDRLLDPGVAEFRPRGSAEQDPSFKQFIPYVMILHGESIFCYTRGTGGAETRLRTFRSLGVGGHVDLEDATDDTFDPSRACENALRRELEEEVRIGAAGKLRRIGLINDDSTEVGSVHLGIAYLFELASGDVEAAESVLENPGFMPNSTVREKVDEFESWSQILIRSFLHSPLS